MLSPDARCAQHPDRPASFACARCGAFTCAPDLVALDGRDYCQPCSLHPEVDWLERYRLSVWGRRDTWTWVIGAGGALMFLYAALTALSIGTEHHRELLEPLLGMLIFLAIGSLDTAFFFGVRWARPVVLLALPALTLLLLVLSGAGFGAIPALIPFGVGVAIFNDGRNRLFFRLEMDRAKLQKTWDVYANNPLARSGLTLSFLGMLFPPAAIVGVIASGIALNRVDPTARPPVGRKGQALGGLALGLLAMALWAVWLVAAVRRAHR
jgi:hypothetical protein